MKGVRPVKYLMFTVVSALIGLGGASAAQSPFHTAARPAASVRVPTKCWAVTVHLEPGMQKPAGFPWKGWIGRGLRLAKDMPLDPVTAEAPLYPGAVRSHAALADDIFMGVPLSSYIKTASAEFSLPTGVGPALRWYRKSFADCGFTAGEHSTTGVEFASSTTSSLKVQVALDPISAHSSLVLYYAYALSHPARPARSFVPDILGGSPTGVKGTITSATVTYESPLNSKRARITLKNPRVIFGLVSIVDQPPAVEVDIGCARPPGDGIVVVFHTANGRAYRLVVDPNCSFAVNGSRPINDENLGVWSYISYLVYKHCFLYGCPSLR